MLAVHVFIDVKPDCVDAFLAATLDNARNSILEEGIACFDVIRQQDDPAKFVLVEVYRTPDAPAKHKETAHYATWRDTVADMLAIPRSRIMYDTCFPDEADW